MDTISSASQVTCGGRPASCGLKGCEWDLGFISSEKWILCQFLLFPFVPVSLGTESLYLHMAVILKEL